MKSKTDLRVFAESCFQTQRATKYKNERMKEYKNEIIMKNQNE